MAFLKTGRLLMKQFLKTEIIFNSILKENIPISQVANKYLDEIRNVNLESNKTNASELLDFPFKTFNKLNKKSLESIITETYKIMKEKKLIKSPNVYHNLIRCYTFNKIDFDMNSVLKDMVNNQIAFDETICSKIIQYYSNHGEIKAVEILLNEMKSKGIKFLEKDKYFIVSGYIISGQPEKAEIFIKENKLNVESHDMFYSRCFGYASIADVTSLKNILAEMEGKNLKFSPRRYYNLYERLIYGHIGKSNLNEIIDLTKDHLVNSSSLLFVLISNLNSADHFNYSIIVIEKLIDLIDSSKSFIELFGTSKCPVNTFKQALTILGPRCRNMSYKKSIFGDLDFDTAFDICHKFSKFENWKVVYYSLINKAISEKSVPYIEKALQLTFNNLQWLQINLMLLQILLPSMQSNGLVSNYEEILDKFPAFRNQILPVIFMKYLCSGDFDRYNELISKEKIIKKFNVILDWKYLVIEILNSLTLTEIKKWSVEAGKCFDSRLINNILTHLLINEMIKASKNESPNEIEELIGYAKEWNVEFSETNINALINAVPGHSELIRSSI